MVDEDVDERVAVARRRPAGVDKKEVANGVQALVELWIGGDQPVEDGFVRWEELAQFLGEGAQLQDAGVVWMRLVCEVQGEYPQLRSTLAVNKHTVCARRGVGEGLLPTPFLAGAGGSSGDRFMGSSSGCCVIKGR